MKKFLSLIAILACLGTAANAQTFTHKFDVILFTPGNANVNTSFTYALGDTLGVVLTQGNLTASDTVAVTNVVGTSIYTLSNLPRLQGDTIFLAKQDTITIPATPGVYPYCVRAFLLNRSNPASFSTLIAATFDTTGMTDCVQLTASAAVGVNDFVKIDNGQSVDLKVYPNPVVGNMMKLDYIALNNSNVEVNVYDLTGRKVMSQSFGKAFKGQEGYGLDISAINNGMYILELRQDGIKATAQFIK